MFIYVALLSVERRHMDDKLKALLADTDAARDTEKMLLAISVAIRRFVAIKALASVMTGVVSYAVLRATGVDFAETWALLNVLLYCIPYLGAAVGVIFPALVAGVQFGTIGAFLGIGFAIGAIHAVAGNFVEPMFMGKSLNLSALAIALSLTFWGMIWGVVGLFLGVPIMVATMIVCANVPGWRWVAILLSKDGRIVDGAE